MKKRSIKKVIISTALMCMVAFNMLIPQNVRAQINSSQGYDLDAFGFDRVGSLNNYTAPPKGLVINPYTGEYINSSNVINDDKFTFSQGEDTSYLSDDETFSIVPVNAGGCSLDFGRKNSILYIWKTHRGTNQRWKIGKKGNYVYFKNENTGQVAEVYDGITANGTSILSADYNGSDKQLWKLDSCGDGTYRILSKLNTNYAMDVQGVSSTSGTPITLYTAHNGANQKFVFVAENTIKEMSDWGSARKDCLGSDWDMWDGSINNKWYYNNTSAKEYKITTASELAGVAQLVRDGVTDFSGRNIILTSDINLCGVEWRRIGNNDRPFRGYFNGCGHAIVGLSITTHSSQDGFFGCIENSVVTNFAIKGTVSGDWNTGGVIGKVNTGYVNNIYSEVAIREATDDNCGGITGRLGGAGFIQNCTQNARINSGDKDPDRGGIAGYSVGIIRYCVNKSSVNLNWNYAGGICGECVDGKVEYCANYGQVSGGGDTERAGGITGMVKGSGIIFGCYNEGYIYSSNDDYIGGIAGKREGDGRVYCCINAGTVKGDDQIGGITGDGFCVYCFNYGSVSGDDDVGAVSGSASRLDWCRSFISSASRLNGDRGDCGAEWVSGDDIISGKLCYDLNRRDVELDMGGYRGGCWPIFYQNIGGDVYPKFSGSRVKKSGNNYYNDGYNVRVSYDKSYGTVTGGGIYKNGKVVLKAEPAAGCVFDHFEIKTARTVASGALSLISKPAATTTHYMKDELTLTEDIKSSYDVKAIFKIYDDVPADLRQKVKIQLECVDDADGWNNDTIPVYLIDSAGEEHLWEVSKSSLDGDGEKVEHTFDLKAESPVALTVHPDFGGGLTFRDYALKAKMWINNSGKSIDSSKVVIKSWPFISSKYGDDYMHMTFGNRGNASVGVINSDGSYNIKNTYTDCKDAWEAAKKVGKNAVVRLDSAWVSEKCFELSGGDGITLDLNGYPLIHSVKRSTKNGEAFKLTNSASLNIVDGSPTRRTCNVFYGGSIQAGRSTNTAGLIQVESKSTLKMTGGTLYNGGTTDDGGAIQCKDANVYLKDVDILRCWSNMAIVEDNEGGAIYVKDGGYLSMENSVIKGCRAFDYGGAISLVGSNSKADLKSTDIIACYVDDNNGGAIYQANGKINIEGGAIKNCNSYDDNGGGIAHNGGDLICNTVVFEGNTSSDRGGAFYENVGNNTKLYNCKFESNSANSDGGAIAVSSNSMELYNVEMCNNITEKDGGAIWVDSDKIFIAGCNIYNNSAKDEGGGVYVDSNHDINIQGKVIINNNKEKSGAGNITLQDGTASQARVYVGGLLEGSKIGINKTSSLSSDGTRVVVGVSEYERNAGYFHSDRGNMDYKKTGTDNEIFMATAVTPFSFAMYLLLVLEIIGAGFVLIPIIRKKRRLNQK